LKIGPKKGDGGGPRRGMEATKLCSKIKFSTLFANGAVSGLEIWGKKGGVRRGRGEAVEAVAQENAVPKGLGQCLSGIRSSRWSNAWRIIEV